MAKINHRLDLQLAARLPKWTQAYIRTVERQRDAFAAIIGTAFDLLENMEVDKAKNLLHEAKDVLTK